MLTEVIKQSESYQKFIKYSIGQLPLKKSIGKGSQGKKVAYTHVADVFVSRESDPEHVRKETSSKRRVKKKVTLSVDDNIIFYFLKAALELGKSISKTKAKKAEAARQVHATHARIMTESVPEPTRRRKSGKVTSDPPKKLKSVSYLTPEEQEDADTMQALKESRKTSRRQPGTAGSSKGTCIIPGVPDESTDVFATSSRGTDEDVEMSNVEVEDSDKGNEEVIDAAREDAEKTSEVKDDAKKTELPPTRSSLSVSSGFGDQFLKLSSNSSLVSTVKDTTDAKINSLLEVKIQFEVPHIQYLSMLRVPVSMISEPSVLTPIQESPSIATVITLPHPSVSTTPHVPQQTTTLIPTPPITTDALTITIVVLESDALSTNYFGSKVGDVFQKELKKHMENLIHKYSLQQIPQVPKNQTQTVDLEQESEKIPSEILKIKKEQSEKQKMSKFTIKSTEKAALKEYDQKSALYQIMHANKSLNINPANHRLKHEDDEDDDDEDPPARSNQGKMTKMRRTKDSESSRKPSSLKETPKGKALSKGSKIGKSASAKEPVVEPIAEVVMDDASDDVVHDDDQPHDASEPKTAKTPNPEWFTQPPRPPTPDSKWNKRQFKEGDFMDLHLNDIEDMLLVDVQHKLFHLTDIDIVDFIVALCMLTRSLIIKKRVEDLQLGVESYQKKLNITPPQQIAPEIKFKEPYTLSHKPPGVIFEDLTKRKRVMRTDELYKFSDRTLKKVWDDHHHRICDLLLEYNKEMPRKKWTAIDKMRSELMVELIDKQMRKRMVIRNLERLVGARNSRWTTN
nr:hypothetical protein [Tanacetum cinerariifolium]